MRRAYETVKNRAATKTAIKKNPAGMYSNPKLEFMYALYL